MNYLNSAYLVATLIFLTLVYKRSGYPKKSLHDKTIATLADLFVSIIFGAVWPVLVISGLIGILDLLRALIFGGKNER